jgi:hypothetical protein
VRPENLDARAADRSYARRMDEVLAGVRRRLRAIYANRSVILAGGPAAGALRPIEQLRELGVSRFLVAASSPGTGEQPAGPDVEMFLPAPAPAEVDLMTSFRAEERAIAQPSDDLLAAVARFDPDGDAIVLAQPFLDVRMMGTRRLFGARRPEWVALEDKTRVDAMFDAAGVPRPLSMIVDATEAAVVRAANTIDAGPGTVWAADAREGFNGAGSRVRWVREDSDRAEAFAALLGRCDRVRVAEFVDGVACSIHGFVVDDGVAAFRPVEMVTLRAPAAPRLRYCGCATYFDPAPGVVATMRAAAVAVGEYLRTSVGFRGAFTLDGIASADGWVATECNPRFGAGLNYLDVARPDLCMLALHYAVAEGVVDVPSAPLEQVVVAAGDAIRWGGAWTAATRQFYVTSTLDLVGGIDGFRRATDGESPDAVLSIGPGRSGGHVRVDFVPERTPHGPSIGPRAAAAFAFADADFDLGLGPLAAAPDLAGDHHEPA